MKGILLIALFSASLNAESVNVEFSRGTSWQAGLYPFTFRMENPGDWQLPPLPEFQPEFQFYWLPPTSYTEQFQMEMPEIAIPQGALIDNAMLYLQFDISYWLEGGSCAPYTCHSDPIDPNSPWYPGEIDPRFGFYLGIFDCPYSNICGGESDITTLARSAHQLGAPLAPFRFLCLSTVGALGIS